MNKQEHLYKLSYKLFLKQKEKGEGFIKDYDLYMRFTYDNNYLNQCLTQEQFNDFLDIIDHDYLSNHELLEMEYE